MLNLRRSPTRNSVIHQTSRIATHIAIISAVVSCLALAGCGPAPTDPDPAETPAPTPNTTPRAPRPAAARPTPITIRPTAATPPRDPVPAQGFQLYGRVTDEAGAPLSSARVEIVRADFANYDVDATLIVTMLANADSEGRYVVTTTTLAGLFTVRVSADGFKSEFFTPTNPAPSPGIALKQDFRLAKLTEITGIVVDETSAPVAGARVRAIAEAVKHPSPMDYAAGVAPVITGADGRFRIAAVAGKHSIGATTADWYFSGIQSVESPTTSVTLVIDRKRTARVVGRVVEYPNNTPVSGATITARSMLTFLRRAPGDAPVSKTTGPDGTFEFTHLPTDIYFNYITDHPNLVVLSRTNEGRQLNMLKPGETQEMEIVMYPGHLVTGKVMNSATGKPIPGVTVQVMKNVAMPDSSDALRDITDAEGRYSIPGVPATVTNLHVDAPNFTRLNRHEEPRFGLTTATLTVEYNISMVPLIQVAGRVLRDDGVPAEGAEFAVRGENTYFDPKTAFTRTAPGAWFQASVNANSHVRVVARAPGFGTNFSPDIAIATADTTGVEVRLTKTATLGGYVLHANEEPATGAKLAATVELSAGRLRTQLVVGEAIIGPNGLFLLPNMPTDKPIALSASLTDYPLVISDDLKPLRAGEQKLDVELRFEESREISGVVVNERGEPMTAVSVSAHPTTQQKHSSSYVSPNASTDDKGRFTIRGLTNQKYTVTALIQTMPAWQINQVTVENVAPGTRDLRLVYRDTRIPIEIRLVAGPTKQPVRDATLKIPELIDLAADPSDPSLFHATVRPPQVFTVRATSPTAGSFYGQSRVAENETGPRTFEYVLLPNITVTGRVVSAGNGPEPLPVPNARITLIEARHLSQAVPKATATTDRDGRFTIPDMPRHQYMVRVMPPAPFQGTETVNTSPGTHEPLSDFGNIYVTPRGE